MMKKIFLIALAATVLTGPSAVNAQLVNTPVSGSIVNVQDEDDWDELLDAYDEYVTSYVSLLKKAMNGDMDALMEYASILEKAQKLSKKMDKAKSDFTVEQLKRYNKITMKMLKAMENMKDM